MRIFWLILTVSCMIFNWACSSPTVNSSSYSKYSAIKDFIKNDSIAAGFLSQIDSGKLGLINLRIANEVIPPMLGEFGGFAFKNKMDLSLSGNVYHYNESITDSLLKLEQELTYEPFRLNDLQNLSDKKPTDGIVFFSKDYGDFISVILVKNVYGKDDRSILTGQNPVLHYLFIFEDSNIRSVLYQETSP